MLFSNQSRVMRSVKSPQHLKEGTFTKQLEKRTARIPSNMFLWAAGGSILGSLALQLTDRKQQANFVGQWAPTFLILGLYNKIVKTMGHD